MTTRIAVVCAFAIAIAGSRLDAQTLTRYRTFELGTGVAAVSTLTGVPQTDVTTLHQRPVLLQDLTWRPSRWVSGSTTDSTDPVEQIAFSFCDDHLFRIVVDYGRDKIEGMTPADLIDAISAVYGPSAKPAPVPARIMSQVDLDSGTPLARWGDKAHTIVLYRMSEYREGFRLVVTDVAIADLAQNGANQALRLDAQEAPQREIARQAKERDDARAAAEKARSTNKGVFTP